MTTFWKPIGPNAVDIHDKQPIKRLGHGLYALWARCSICTWSGPFESFTLLEHPDHAQPSTICDGCAKTYPVLDDLTRSGWIVRG